ncbi:MAG: Zn-dependent hydrolase including glyoxylase-like protein, partial [Firmicutes bacterium]|nr:Zn-dependent hydrolase including glyoxylase-like protein [Bacillota bacterium]
GKVSGEGIKVLQKISDHLNFLISETGFTYCNCIVVEDNVRAILDTGADKKSIDSIHPESIDMVLNTHHHYDHTRGNQYFQNSRLYIHALDYTPLSSREDYIHYNSIDMWEGLMPNCDYAEASVIMGIEEDDVERNMRVDQVLNNDQIIDFGHTQMEVIHTPGHSAGHCSFWFPNEEINRLIELNPPRMTSCHINDICYDCRERLTEFRDRIIKREERIFKSIKKQPVDLHQLADQKLVYRMHPTPFVLFWEKCMLLKHLERLQQKGFIEMVENGLYHAL